MKNCVLDYLVSSLIDIVTLAWSCLFGLLNQIFSLPLQRKRKKNFKVVVRRVRLMLKLCTNIETYLGVWNRHIKAKWQLKKARRFLRSTDSCLHKVAALYFEVLWISQTSDTTTFNGSVEARGHKGARHFCTVPLPPVDSPRCLVIPGGLGRQRHSHRNFSMNDFRYGKHRHSDLCPFILFCLWVYKTKIESLTENK